MKVIHDSVLEFFNLYLKQQSCKLYLYEWINCLLNLVIVPILWQLKSKSCLLLCFGTLIILANLLQLYSKYSCIREYMITLLRSFELEFLFSPSCREFLNLLLKFLIFFSLKNSNLKQFCLKIIRNRNEHFVIFNWLHNEMISLTTQWMLSHFSTTCLTYHTVKHFLVD